MREEKEGCRVREGVIRECEKEEYRAREGTAGFLRGVLSGTSTHEWPHAVGHALASSIQARLPLLPHTYTTNPTTHTPALLAL